MTPTTTTLTTSRSRALAYQRCPRSRWLLHEAPIPDQPDAHGLQSIRAAVPLVTGSTIHAGLAELLKGESLAVAFKRAQFAYMGLCEGRRLDVGELYDTSFTFNEQLRLCDKLLELAHSRVIPALLRDYEVLEVEKMDTATLSDGIVWRSIPDALLRRRDDNDLYLLSWKTTSMVGAWTDDSARTDMQGLSEAWAIEQRHRWGARIRGIQMVYLVKGQWREASKQDCQSLGIPENTRITQNPLLYGYADSSVFPPRYATHKKYQCSAPHPMRKSSYYPTGECPGDGRNHIRGDEWQIIQTPDNWQEMIANGQVETGGTNILDTLWAIPIPNYRTRQQSEKWLTQTRTLEERACYDAEVLRQAVENGEPLDGKLADVMFPQFTHSCRAYNRRCDAWEICHGPKHVAADPLASGLYMPKAQYQPTQDDDGDEE